MFNIHEPLSSLRGAPVKSRITQSLSRNVLSLEFKYQFELLCYEHVMNVVSEVMSVVKLLLKLNFGKANLYKFMHRNSRPKS